TRPSQSCAILSIGEIPRSVVYSDWRVLSLLRHPPLRQPRAPRNLERGPVLEGQRPGLLTQGQQPPALAPSRRLPGRPVPESPEAWGRPRLRSTCSVTKGSSLSVPGGGRRPRYRSSETSP